MTKDTAQQQRSWWVFAETVPGASHLAQDIPNQDAFRVEPETPLNTPFVATLADGHGDGRHCRSKTGAIIATWTATTVLVDFLKAQERSPSIERNLRKIAYESLPREIVKGWTKSVYRDLEKTPLRREEFALRQHQATEQIIDDVLDNPLIAYGSTLLAVAVTNSELVAIQLGDGDILLAGADGIIRRPFADTAHGSDDVWLETDSLSATDAWRQVKVAVLPNSVEVPQMLLLSTDGYRKAFADEDAYEKVMPDFLAAVRIDGGESMQRSLADILSRTSARSGGDDITVVFACNAAAINTYDWLPHSVDRSIPLTEDLPSDLTLSETASQANNADLVTGDTMTDHTSEQL